MKKLLFCVVFFLVTPLFLFLTFFGFSISSKSSKNIYSGYIGLGSKVLGLKDDLSENVTKIYASSLENPKLVADNLGIKDARPLIIERYLKKYNSPLLPFAQKILTTADNYKVDPFLLVAIAQQESNLGKKSPENCYNAWGWGIHAKGTKCYQSWEEAIQSVTSGIAKDYCEKGYCDDPCVMMKKYTPVSNGSWCYGVNRFLTDLHTGSI